MIIGYARVSTAHDEQTVSVQAQVEQLRQAGCDRVIEERASAYKEDARRPGWQELQALVASGKVRKVVAVSQSRLSRREDVLVFLRICARMDVEVTFLDGTTGDMQDPAGLLMTGVLAAVNQVDSLIKSLNTKNGLQRRKAAGYYACGRVPFGYCYDGQYVRRDPQTFAEAQLLWGRLEEAEFNCAGVVRRYDYDWSTRGLRRWIRNPILRGVAAGQSEPVEALISQEQYNAAMEVIDGRQQRGVRAPRRKRLLSGLVRCQACELRLHYVMAAGKPRLKCSNLKCRWYGRGLAEWKIKEQVLAALTSQASAMASLAVAPQLEVDAKELERRDKLIQLRGLRDQGVANLELAIAALEGQAPAPERAGPNWAALAETFSRPGVLECALEEDLRKILLEFLDEILYVGDPLTVEVRLRQGASGGTS